MSGGESGSTKTTVGSTVQIDRLLDVMVKQDASDLHITVGRPPTVRLNGRLRNLQTKILDPDDTMALMKSITPEKIRRNFKSRVEQTLDLVSAMPPASVSVCFVKKHLSPWCFDSFPIVFLASSKSVCRKFRVS